MFATGRRGFTLLELLTVLGIFGSLLALALPAADTARASAVRVLCASRLHELGVATTHYAARHNGLLPPFGSSAVTRCRNYYLSQPPYDYIEDWTALWADGQLSQADMLYCPSTRTASHQFNTTRNRWSGELVRIGYSRRYLPRAGSPPQSCKVDCGAAVAADLLVSPAHLQAQHRIGVNVLYAGGGVQFHPDIGPLMAAAGMADNTPGDNGQLDAVWAALDRRGVKP